MKGLNRDTGFKTSIMFYEIERKYRYLAFYKF